jgi:hypothetical protein
LSCSATRRRASSRTARTKLPLTHCSSLIRARSPTPCSMLIERLSSPIVTSLGANDGAAASAATGTTTAALLIVPFCFGVVVATAAGVVVVFAALASVRTRRSDSKASSSIAICTSLSSTSSRSASVGAWYASVPQLPVAAPAWPSSRPNFLPGAAVFAAAFRSLRKTFLRSFSCAVSFDLSVGGTGTASPSTHCLSSPKENEATGTSITRMTGACSPAPAFAVAVSTMRTAHGPSTATFDRLSANCQPLPFSLAPAATIVRAETVSTTPARESASAAAAVAVVAAAAAPVSASTSNSPTVAVSLSSSSAAAAAAGARRCRCTSSACDAQIIQIRNVCARIAAENRCRRAQLACIAETEPHRADRAILVAPRLELVLGGALVQQLRPRSGRNVDIAQVGGQHDELVAQSEAREDRRPSRADDLAARRPHGAACRPRTRSPRSRPRTRPRRSTRPGAE